MGQPLRLLEGAFAHLTERIHPQGGASRARVFFLWLYKGYPANSAGLAAKFAGLRRASPAESAGLWMNYPQMPKQSSIAQINGSGRALDWPRARLDGHQAPKSTIELVIVGRGPAGF